MSDTDIAIVGLGALFPGASDAQAFWRNIVGSVDAIGTIPPARWDPAVFYDPDGSPASDRFYCRRGGFLDDLATFDPARFGIMPSTVDGAEPDQLLALGVAAEAIADAGGERVLPDRAKVGVVVGRGGYLTPGCARLDQRVQVNQLVSAVSDLVPGLDQAALRLALRERLGPDQPEASIGLVPNLAASRIANRFDLLGPAYTVDAACASGLVAVEHAVWELVSGRCDAMLAGAVHVSHHPTLWSVFTQLRALSPREQIRPFDRSADGTLLSEGVGMVLLKRAKDAMDSGDRIYAVIRGVGTASDGRSTSLMTPNPSGQLLAVQRAWQEARLEPGEDLGLIEAHGTATPAGDTAEIATVMKAFGSDGAPIGIGTVKSMIGHAMPAAGIAGLIKAALAVYHATMPPTLHIDSPHPDLAGTRFSPVLTPRPWEGPRRAAINAFGFGGINAHAVLESTGPSGTVVAQPLTPVLRLSADSPAELEHELLATDSELLSRIGRRADDRPCRLVVWNPDARRLKLARQVVARGRKWTGRHDIWFSPQPMPGQIAFLFPGFEQRGTSEIAGEESVVDHALTLLTAGRHQARLLKDAGIVPDALAGHSMGEWTAMIVAGIYPTIDSFVESLRPGMVAVADVVYAALGCSAARAQSVLDTLQVPVVVSHDNCPHQSVVCGPAAELAKVVAHFKAEGVLAQVMPFRTGFHTPALAPHLAAARATVESLAVHAPSVPVYSATSLAPMPSSPAEIRELVLRHLVEPVRFRPLISRLHDSGIRAFVQVGQGSLRGFVEDTLGDQEHLTVAGDDSYRAAAALWAFGFGKRSGGRRLSLGLQPLRLDPITVPSQPIAVDNGTVVGAALNAMLAETTAVAREVADALAAGPRTGTGSVVDPAVAGSRVAAAGSELGAGPGLGLARAGSAVDPAAAGSRVATADSELGAGQEFGLVRAGSVVDSAVAGLGVGAAGSGLAAGPGLGLVRAGSAVDSAVAGLGAGAAGSELGAGPEFGLVRAGSAVDPAAVGSAAGPELGVVRAGSAAAGSVPEVAGARAAIGRAPGASPATWPASPMPAANPAADSTLPDSIEFTRVFSLQTMPDLIDHSIFPQPAGWPDLSDGFPIVPITTLVEVIKDAARRLVPAQPVIAVEDVRAMRWLEVEPATEVLVTARRDGDRIRVRVGEFAEGIVRFGDSYPQAGMGSRPDWVAPREAPVKASQLYSDGWMFHGPQFAGVSDIGILADNGITGTLTVLPASGSLLDCAGQLIGHWMQVSLNVDQTVLPTGIAGVEYFRPDPAAGDRIEVAAWIHEVTDNHMRGDLDLRTADGELWCRVTGWTTRRFTTDDRIWQVKLRAERNTLAEPQPGGWVLVTEKWVDSATRELMMRRYLTAAERADYNRLDLRTQRQWLLHRVAVKDAVRRWLWSRGAGPIFPAELTVTDEGDGVRVHGAFATPAVAVAHCADPRKPSAGGCAVAIAGEPGVEISIRPGTRAWPGGAVVTGHEASYVVDWKPAGGQHARD